MCYWAPKPVTMLLYRYAELKFGFHKTGRQSYSDISNRRLYFWRKVRSNEVRDVAIFALRCCYIYCPRSGKVRKQGPRRRMPHSVAPFLSSFQVNSTVHSRYSVRDILSFASNVLFCEIQISVWHPFQNTLKMQKPRQFEHFCYMITKTAPFNADNIGVWLTGLSFAGCGGSLVGGTEGSCRHVWSAG